MTVVYHTDENGNVKGTLYHVTAITVDASTITTGLVMAQRNILDFAQPELPPWANRHERRKAKAKGRK